MDDPIRFRRAIEGFDALNAQDPRRDSVGREALPRELLYSLRMSERLDRFLPEASEALRLAVRAQHLARWRVPREDFPEGRDGYRRWRTHLMGLHAELAGEILREAGYGQETIARVASLLRKEGIKRDPEAQALEDVACLVFLEHYFESFATEHDDAKVVDILRKTLKKMSARGREAALDVPLGDRGGALVRQAVGG